MTETHSDCSCCVTEFAFLENSEPRICQGPSRMSAMPNGVGVAGAEGCGESGGVISIDIIFTETSPHLPHSRNFRTAGGPFASEAMHDSCGFEEYS